MPKPSLYYRTITNYYNYFFVYSYIFNVSLSQRGFILVGNIAYTFNIDRPNCLRTKINLFYLKTSL
jgi:hypothetical protein